MELERRGRVRRSHARSNWKQEDLDACDRQAVWSACLPDGSRVNRHEPVDEQQKALNAKLRGHYQYYARPTNYRSIRKFYQEVCHIWKKWLSRRTRGDGMTWATFKAILRRHPLMRPRILHSWQVAE